MKVKTALDGLSWWLSRLQLCFSGFCLYSAFETHWEGTTGDSLHVCLLEFFLTSFFFPNLYVSRLGKLSLSPFLFKKILTQEHVYWLLGKGREREKGRGRGRNIDVWEKHWSVASHMLSDWRLNLQPRYVPWPGTEPATFLVYGTMLQPTEPPSQGCLLFTHENHQE